VIERDLSVATRLAGVNARLKPGGIREMHWRKEGSRRPPGFGSSPLRPRGFRQAAPRELVDAVIAHHEVLVTAVRDRLPPPPLHDQVLRRVTRCHKAARTALEHVPGHSVDSTIGHSGMPAVLLLPGGSAIPFALHQRAENPTRAAR
jgi:hypothetical protein